MIWQRIKCFFNRHTTTHQYRLDGEGFCSCCDRHIVRIDGVWRKTGMDEHQ